MCHQKNYLFLGLILLSPALTSQAQTNSQAEVAQRGTQVMPFALAKTMHLFSPTPDGGIQRVIARNPQDHQQITLIRQHLQEMAQKFKSGDYSGPAFIHGEHMPGLQILQKAKPDDLQIRYAEEIDGASLVFQSRQPEIINAIHDWFTAQLQDHGHDAMHMQHHGSGQ